MAGTKVSALPAATVLADADLLPIVDVSDTTQAPTGTTKSTTAADVAAYLLSATDVGAGVAPALAYVDAKWYGASPAATAALNRTAIADAVDAVADNGTVVIQPGTYDLGSSTLDATGKGFNLDARGVTLTSTAATILKLGGTLTLDVTEVAEDLSKGEKVVTVDDASGLAAGDLIRIRSSGEVFNDDRPSVHFKGELAEIVSIASDDLTLRCGLNDSYDATTYDVAVDRIQPAAVHVSGLTIIGDGATDQVGLVIEAFEGATVTDVTVRDVEYMGILASVGMGMSIKGCVAKGSDDTVTGYGIRLADTDGATVSDCFGTGNRHSYDTGGTSPSRNITFSNCTAKGDTSAGFSSHGDSDRITFSNCWADWCGGGFVIRGSNSTIRGGGIRGTHGGAQSYVHGITIGDAAPNQQGNGLGGKGLTIDGVVIDLTGHGVTSVQGIRSNAAIENAKIVNSVIKGHSAHAIYVDGDTVRNFMVKGNVLDSSGVTVANAYAFLYAPLSNVTGNNAKYVDFSENIVIGDGGTNVVSAVRIHGNFDNADPADAITVCRNSFRATSRGVDFGSGFYNRARCTDNVMTSIATPINLNAANWVAYPVVTPNTFGDARTGVVDVRSAAPASGTWRVGDIVWNTATAAAGVPGWVCTTAGTPGTWKAMAAVAS